MTLHTAMGLYKLTDSELIWELQLDTRCLIGWNAGTIVLAFRGAASMTNALADLQVGILGILLFVLCYVALLLSFNHLERFNLHPTWPRHLWGGTRHKVYSSAGVEGGPPAFEGSYMVLQSALGACRFHEELAGWQLQPEGHSSCHGSCTHLPGWP